MHVQLIPDEQGVAASRGVACHLNAAAKQPRMPALLPAAPHQRDSFQLSWPGTVLYGPRDQAL